MPRFVHRDADKGKDKAEENSNHAFKLVELQDMAAYLDIGAEMYGAMSFEELSVSDCIPILLLFTILLRFFRIYRKSGCVQFWNIFITGKDEARYVTPHIRPPSSERQRQPPS